MRLKLLGIRVEVSFLLAAALTLVIIFDSELSVTACLVAVVIHEAGHIAAMRMFSSVPEEIRLSLFEFRITDRGKYRRSNGAQLLITLAGILANLAAAFLTWLILQLTGWDLCDKLFCADITLAVFNSLPVFTLDGGQALTLLLSLWIPGDRICLIMDIISFLVLVPCALLGFLVLLESGNNFSLLLTSVYLIALIILRNR